MLVWVLHVPQTDGSIIIKACNSTDEAWRILRDAEVQFNSGTGPIDPKIGDRFVFSNNNKEVAYAVLGQVRFS
jgi:hypothetical protein